MQPQRAAPERPYSWGQYVKTLFLLIGFGWLVAFILITISDVQTNYSLALRNPLAWIGIVLLFGVPSAALTAIVFLSAPLWFLMRHPILPQRAILAGFLSSTLLIIVFAFLSVWAEGWRNVSITMFTDELIWVVPFILLCTLSAWIIQRIIGPGEPPKDIAKVFD